MRWVLVMAPVCAEVGAQCEIRACWCHLVITHSLVLGHVEIHPDEHSLASKGHRVHTQLVQGSSPGSCGASSLGKGGSHDEF